jgi:hypothetical protein
VFIIKSKQDRRLNEYEISGEVATLKLNKKDGTALNISAVIDLEDLKAVLEKGVWYAEWNKDFNSYLVVNSIEYYSEGRRCSGKQTLQAFLLKVHTKAPIRHINGDTLDNRKANLEIYVQKNTNNYEFFDQNSTAIILRDKYGKKEAKTLIDNDDLDRVINYGYAWVCHKIKGEAYAVANTPGGRVYLNRFIMNTPENMVTHAINLNNLDNRKTNLKNLLKEILVTGTSN